MSGLDRTQGFQRAYQDVAYFLGADLPLPDKITVDDHPTELGLVRVFLSFDAARVDDFHRWVGPLGLAARQNNGNDYAAGLYSGTGVFWELVAWTQVLVP